MVSRFASERTKFSSVLAGPSFRSGINHSKDPMNGIERIAAERQRQIEREGWTPEHDDEHRNGEMAAAAACYALAGIPHWAREQAIANFWPWDTKWWKPDSNDDIRDLEKAGALIAAEIERRLRAKTQVADEFGYTPEAAMGLFDYLRCEMPLPLGAPSVSEWQTKSLDCGMNWYAIRLDGKLVDRKIRQELKPGAPPQPEFFSEAYFEWSSNWWEPKAGPDELIDYTGEVRFYSHDADKQWWEFCAFVKGGRCFEIVQIEPTPVEF